MAWFDFLQSLGQGVMQADQNIENRARRSAEDKRLAAEEMRRQAEESRRVGEDERERFDYFISNAPDDWEGTPDDEMVKLGLKHGQKSRFINKGGKLGLATSPEREERKIKLEQIRATHEDLLRRLGDGKAQMERKNKILTAIDNGTFYQVYKDPQTRLAELTFAGLPENLKYATTEERERDERRAAMNTGGVIAAGIHNAGENSRLEKQIGAGMYSNRSNPSTPDIDNLVSNIRQRIGQIESNMRPQDYAAYVNDANQRKAVRDRAIADVTAALDSVGGRRPIAPAGDDDFEVIDSK